MRLRPHDLLRLTDPGRLAGDAPAWVPDALSRTPWVVVRRSAAPAGFVAVGVRGGARSQRHALTIAQAAIEHVVSPEQLAGPATRRLPAFSTLTAARGYLDECAMPWGPTGSVGFELASGAATVTEDSDLDLVVRAPALTTVVLQRLSALQTRLAALHARVDCQVETSNGAVALAELTSATSTVLVKTPTGPRLAAVAELLA